jgi:seryl-tRNA synthetase
MVRLPALPMAEVPYGVDENENVVIKTVGEIPQFDFKPLPHWEIGPQLGILNLSRASS